MRELKFRAWDADMREMVDVSGIQFHSHSSEPNPCIIDQYNDLRDLSDVQVMQYTGLKDANGVEIYEGDLVDDDGMIVTVIWDQANASFVLDSHCGVDGFDLLDVDALVIGNIYENPELLEAK